MDRTEADEKMNVSSDQTVTAAKTPKGGYITMPFIIANESFEKIASMGLTPNMIFYLIKGYRMSSADGASLLHLWSALSNFTPLAGAFLSDSYFGKFKVIAVGSIFSLLGMILLWLTAMVPKAKPSKLDLSADSGQLTMLYFAFLLMSIGSGGIRPCSMAFGADQLVKNKDDPKDERKLKSFLSWYYASVGLSIVIALTVIVYIQDHLGFKTGFGIPAILMLISVLAFLAGSPLYVKVKANKSLLTGLAQVIVVAFKNRSLPYPATGDNKYHIGKESEIVAPSKNLRFLNKACIIRDGENDINLDGSTAKPWNICPVEHVEALKSFVRLLPICSSGIIIYMAVTQGTLTVIQASSMDRHMTSNFKIPAGTISVFAVVTFTIWIGFYDRVIVPLLAKYAGQPNGLSSTVRMGMGQVLSILAMVVSAFVEIIRRRRALDEGLANNPRGIVGMSAFWLVPQLCVAGLAEGLNIVGQLEFYYSQLPKNMTSLAMALFALNNGFAGLLGTFLIKTVDRITKRGGKQSWVATNPNKGHYDYYYWFVAILCTVNFFYFLACCWAYGPSEKRVSDDLQVMEVEESAANKPQYSDATS